MQFFFFGSELRGERRGTALSALLFRGVGISSEESGGGGFFFFALDA